MAYDSKSNIGQQVANPGNPQLGQGTVYEQKISSIPLGPNTAKQIDLLSMDQFGHNQSVLRKDLSILEANSVNTDKEYGIMQVEDKFELSQVNAETIDYENEINVNEFDTRLVVSKVCKYTHGENSKKIVSNVTFGDTGVAYLIPNVFYGLPGDTTTEVDSIQWIGHETTLQKVNGISVDNNAGSGTLDDDFKLKESINGSTHWANVERLRITIDNRTSKDIVLKYYVGIYNSGTLAEVYQEKTFSSNLITTHYIWNQGQRLGKLSNITMDHDGNESRFFVKYELDFRDELKNISISLPMYVTTFVIPSGVSTFYNNNPMPECSIEIEYFKDIVNDSEGYTRSVIELSKNKSASQSIRIITEPLTNVIDYGLYPGIILAERYNLTTDTITLPVYSIGQDVKLADDTVNEYNIYFVCPDSDCRYYIASKESFSVDKLISYYSLIQLASSRTLGIAKRDSGKLVLCIKDGDKYFTPSIPSDNSDSGRNLSNINVISSTYGSVSFVAEYSNGSKFYFNFKSIADFSAGLLYPKTFQDKYMFSGYDITEDVLVSSNSKNSISLNAAIKFGVKLDQIAFNQDVFVKESSESITGNLYSPVKIVLSSPDMIGNSMLKISALGEFVSTGLCFPMSICLQHDKGTSISNNPRYGKRTVNVFTTPSVDKTTLQWSTLPLRMNDEYPSIFYCSKIGDKSFVQGKTKFVSVGGTVYSANEFNLIGDPSQVYISETGTLFMVAGYFFIAKSNLTNVYQFTELGMQLSMTIEDEIICNPVVSSVGIVMCGRTGIWTLTKEGVIKIWKSTNTISQASLKTDLDNSCIAILDNNSYEYDIVTSSDDYIVCGNETSDNTQLCSGRTSFTAVTINQFGFVSSQSIVTDLNTVDFIDIGAESELLILDLTGSNTLNTLVKGDDTENSFTIQSNQQIEMYQETMYATLNKLRLFAKGSGTITININDLEVGMIIVSSDRFKEYNLTLNVDMNMLDYKITCTAGVKLMQRVVGIITIKEEFYG